MSLINDLKKIFFGAKAVAGSAAEKATDSAKEAAGEIKERTAEWTEAAREEAADLSAKAKDTLSDLKEKIWEETSHAIEKGRELKDQAETWVREKTETPPPPSQPTNFSAPASPEAQTGIPSTPKASSGPIDFEADDDEPAKTPKAPGALAETSDALLNQAAKAGAQALDQAKELGGKVMDVSEQVGGALLEKGGQLMDKAMGLGDKLAGKVEDLVTRAQEEADRESLQDAAAKAEALNRQAQERADNAVKDSKSSLLDGKDDFFAKAERFARGEYHDTSLSKDPDHKPQGKSGKAAGFDDQDGDGNELIDDAIIDES